MTSSKDTAELNRRIHEATGKHWHEWTRTTVLPTYYKCPCGAEVWPANLFEYKNPDYANSLTYAFELVEWMRREKGLAVTIQSDEKDGWGVCVEKKPRMDILSHAGHESLPTAITLACAAALGIKEEG